MYSQADVTARREERDRMVDKQIIPRGVRDPQVIDALRNTPRHLFLGAAAQADAYVDHPVAIPCGQTISQPYIVAAMTEMLRLTPATRVLEIGTGSGYQTAVLAALAARVVSIERHPGLADTARQRLYALGHEHVLVVVGDGTLGHPAGAPYDAILVTAAAPDIPTSLQEQLAVGGRLVAPVGSLDVQQLVTVVREGEQEFSRATGFSCRFVPLVGAEGWREPQR